MFIKNKAKFLISAASQEQFPKEELPEIAFVGRSNVGKSSLINHLTSLKHLAKVAKSPGKTQTINFFDVDETLRFVDLPGYGFAKVSQKLRHSWGDLTHDYLKNRKALKLLLILVDLRHPPTKEDLSVAIWAKHFQKPFLLVFTKSDKLRLQKQLIHQRKNLTIFYQTLHSKPLISVNYSIKDAKAKNALIQEIRKSL